MPVRAQAAPYECVNESIDIDIDSQSLDAALDVLSRQTHCPISRDANIDGLRGRRIRGTYTPAQALKALVKGTGLTGQAIKQGLTVMGRPHTAMSASTRYDCQNASLPMTIRSMPLDQALVSLSQQTHCPVSRAFEVGGLISRPVQGMYTPLSALRAMLEGTGLRGAMIRQGLQVLPVAQ